MAGDLFRGEIWEIYGTRGNDHLVIEADGKHPNVLNAWNGKKLIAQASASVVRRIRVHAGAGDDGVFVKISGYTSRRYGLAVDAGDGNDQVFSRTAGFSAYGGAGNDSLYGGTEGDVLVGGTGVDDIIGYGGADRIEGGEGNDQLIGGAGRDTVIGAFGNDRLEGGEDRDWLDGSAGKDSLFGGTDADTLVGGRQGDLLERDHHRDLISKTAQDHEFVTNLRQDWRKNPEGFARTRYAFAGGVVGFLDGAYRMSDGVFVLAGTTGSNLSTTNVQVTGVDEADLIENDGDYLYAIIKQELVITDIRDPKSMRVVSRTRFDGEVRGMYLDGDRLTVVWQENGPLVASPGADLVFQWRPGMGMEQKTTITTFELGDRTAPAKVNEVAIDGAYTTSRYVDGRVYLVSTYYDQTPTVEGTYVEDFLVPESPEDFAARVAKQASGYGAGYTITADGSTREGSLTQLAATIDDSTYNPNVSSYVSLIDTTGGATVDSMKLQGGYFGAVYMTASSIYLTTASYDVTIPSFELNTEVVKLGVDGDHLVAEGRGVVEGSVRGQFAFDETADGLLRVTSQVGNGRTASTTFTILKDVGDELKAQSKLEGIAPGENLYATRYVGDRAYFITYGPDWSKVIRFSDPLFVVDATNASDPKLLGELKIPGYSQYLHPVDDTHLIGLGQRDDDADGSPDGLQLSLFDVSNPAKPTRVDTYEFGQMEENDHAWSSAEMNHLAFTYAPDTGLLAVPFQTWNGRSGVEVLKVEKSTGFDHIATLANRSTESWLETRGMLAGDAAFALSGSTLTSALLASPGEQTTIELGQ